MNNTTTSKNIQEVSEFSKILSSSFDFIINDIMFYTKDGELIFYSRINKKLTNSLGNNEFSVISSLIKKISRFSLDSQSKMKNDLIFQQVSLKKEEYEFINFTKSNIIILGIFPLQIKNSIIRLFLLHVGISFLNFMGEKSDFVSYNTHYSSNDFLNSKIYETFLFLPLKQHFINITRSIFKKNTLMLSNIKYKNFFLIDLGGDNVIFSLKSVLNKKKTIKIETFPSLFTELLFHSHNLKAAYERKFSNRYDSIEYQDFFVKLEYTSTYPRLTFIIKFLPILKGVALVHVYSQSKISRNDSEGNKIPYKEFDIIYGSEMNKETSHIEYRYKEPKLLKEIECFLIEFFLSANNAFGFFYYPKHEMKCFCPDIIKIIEDNNDNLSANSHDKIIGKITNILYEEYLKIKEKERYLKEEVPKVNNNFVNMDDINLHLNGGFNDTNLLKNEMISNYQWNFLSKATVSNLFQISKKLCLEILFGILNDAPLLNLNEATINLTKLEDKSDANLNNDKISELIRKDFSGITRNKKLIINQNSNNIFDESLFNLNISVIPSKEVKPQNKKKKKDSKVENKSKSVILVNKIQEKLKQNDNHIEYNNLNTNMLLSFGGEDNIDMDLFEEKNDNDDNSGENDNEVEDSEDMEGDNEEEEDNDDNEIELSYDSKKFRNNVGTNRKLLNPSMQKM